MKNIIQLHLLARLSMLILFGLAATTGAMAQTTTFFSDTFANGSSIASLSPTYPATNRTDYQEISIKVWSPPPSIAARDMSFGIAATKSGTFEIQALFTTNGVALSSVGDYIQMTVVFTNTSGILTTNGALGFGLYSGNQMQPVPGGITDAYSPSNEVATGYVQNWQGYVGQVYNTGSASRIMTRLAQTGTANNNQDLVTSGSGGSYSSPAAATVGATTVSTVTLTAGSVYTEVLNITLTGVNTLSITNSLYNGPDTNSALLQSFGGVASGATYISGAFDGLAIGYFAKNNVSSNTMDIASIQVVGQSTPVQAPPTINSQPVSIQVATNGSGAFSVAATGFGVTYQWHRNGTNLVDDGYNISGSTSSQLIVSHVGVGDALSGANGYYVTVSGTGNYSTNSTTNSLTLVPAKNLTWNGSSVGAAWDLNTSANWKTNGTPGAYFNFGDAVTFDDAATLKVVTLTGNYLSASSVTVNSSASTYTFAGTGSFAGPGTLNYIGAGQLTLNNANTYSGGTLISNALAYVYLQNYNGLGTGPVTLAKAGGTIETVTGGSATLGFNGDINVLDDFTIRVDGVGTFATVFLGDLFGTSGKTLSLNPAVGGTTNRFRVYGTNTVLNANLVIDDPTVTGDAAGTQAMYVGTVLSPYGASGSQIYNGIISGVGGIVQRGSCITYLNNSQNTYSGGTVPTSGTIALGANSVPTTGTVTSGPLGTGPLLLAPEVNGTTSSGTVIASGGSRTIANPLKYPSGTNNLTLIIGGTNDLTFTSPFGLNGLDGVTSAAYSSRFFQVANTGATTFAGAISDSSSFYALTKTGAGEFFLNAANTYTGPTTNSAGLLAGSGSLAGPVFVLTNASIGGGSAASIGTLTIHGNLILSGNAFIRLDKSLAQSNDMISVSGILTNNGTGTVTVTNIGVPALAVGDSFKIFSGAVSNGAAFTVTGGGVSWTNNLAVNGSIQVIPSFTIASYPTNISYSVSSGGLTITWPATHQGWILQNQTNFLSVGLTTATNTWHDIPNTENVISTNFPVNPANPTVFYRLRHP